jgi:enamine deaminase RidA (YjgF/YER057c/UK114 family)
VGLIATLQRLIGRRAQPGSLLVNPSSLPPPSGYSNGILVPATDRTRLLFIAGQIGWDQRGRLQSEHFATQFGRALDNVLSVVNAAGGRPESLVKLTIFIVDTAEYLAQRSEVGDLYRARMGRHFPAMSLVAVKALVEPGAKVEIEGIAAIRGSP